LFVKIKISRNQYDAAFNTLRGLDENGMSAEDRENIEQGNGVR
jgi:hypothetical protein